MASNEPPPCSMCHGQKVVTITVEDEEAETARDISVTCSQCGGTGKGS